jgi:hypothetical protein
VTDTTTACSLLLLLEGVVSANQKQGRMRAAASVGGQHERTLGPPVADGAAEQMYCVLTQSSASRPICLTQPSFLHPTPQHDDAQEGHCSIHETCCCGQLGLSLPAAVHSRQVRSLTVCTSTG